MKRNEGGGARRYKGVRMRTWGKWVSEIRLPNTRARLWLGSYSTPEQAARAYDVALVCLRGPSASLNFPESPPSAPLGLPHRHIQELAAAAAAAAAAASAEPVWTPDRSPDSSWSAAEEESSQSSHEDGWESDKASSNPPPPPQVAPSPANDSVFPAASGSWDFLSPLFDDAFDHLSLQLSEDSQWEQVTMRNPIVPTHNLDDDFAGAFYEPYLWSV